MEDENTAPAGTIGADCVSGGGEYISGGIRAEDGGADSGGAAVAKYGAAPTNYVLCLCTGVARPRPFA